MVYKNLNFRKKYIYILVTEVRNIYMVSKSSKKWLDRQEKDYYVKKAKKEGLRSRAIFKLRQIQEKHSFVKKDDVVLELGAAPGSWTKDLAAWVGDRGKVFAVDRLEMNNVDRVELVQFDITDKGFYLWLEECFADKKVDIVISDMAPNACGDKHTDRLRSIALCEDCIYIAKKVLCQGGSLLMKSFNGIDFDNLLKQLRSEFKKVKVLKPDASRRSASEVYILAQEFIGGNFDPKGEVIDE